MSDLNYTLALALGDEFAERLAREYQPVDEEPPIAPSPDPSVAVIKKLVQTSFWASLTKEEGTFHDFRLALMPVVEGTRVCLFSGNLCRSDLTDVSRPSRRS